MMERRKCRSKICWELLELAEKQSETIKRLSIRNRELESIINSEATRYRK